MPDVLTRPVEGQKRFHQALIGERLLKGKCRELSAKLVGKS
jgi:hypothetical protein